MATSTAAIYQAVYNHLITGGEMDANGLNKMLEKWDPAPLEKHAGTLGLVNLCANLRADMASAGNKTAGKGNLEKAMLSIIDAADRPGLRGAFMQDGKQCVCDGYRAIRLNDAINLPKPEFRTEIELGKVFEHNEAEYSPLALPTIGELKTHIKITKAENKARFGRHGASKGVTYDFGEGKPLVNAAYLLDILTAFPDATATYGRDVQPIYFASEMGDAVLMTVRRNTVKRESA